MVHSEINEAASKALQETFDVMLGVGLFMEVAMNHGLEFINPSHPEFESKRNEVTDMIELKMKKHPEIQHTIEAAATQVLMALYKSMAKAVNEKEPSKIIQPGSLKLH